MSNETSTMYANTYDKKTKEVVETYQRFRIVKAWSNKKLIPMVNAAVRNGWVVTHWEFHHGVFPAARLVKTLRRDNDEALSV
jgi:hypothetical protein